jgi:ElaB/YqjD/DUF883 family membrane-anchored ribosome-binding protein
MTYDPNRPITTTPTEREFDRTADSSSGMGNTVADKAQNALGTATDRASEIKDKATQVTSDVRDRAQQIGSQAADKADAATTTVGSKMTDVAQTLRNKAPASGPVGTAAATTADSLEKAGSYLQQQDLVGMRSDLESLIRRHPMESLLIGLGVGYLLARSTRR